MNNFDEQNGPNTPPFGSHRDEVRSGGAPGADHGTTGNTGQHFSSDAFNTGPQSGPEFVTHDATQPQPAWDQQPWAAQPPPFAPQPTPTPAPPAATTTATKPRRRLGRMIGVVALSAVVGAGAGIGTLSLATGGTSASAPISVTTSPASQSPVLDGTVAAAAKKIEPSVVTITVQAGQSGDIGSGVIVDTDGHILTNNHVVEAAKNGTITVTFSDGSTKAAKIVGTSAANDLAVIKVDGGKDLQPATFAKSGSLSVGQAVVAAGAPLGLSKSITSGIVSNQTRPVRSGSNNDAVYMAVQTDAAINPGNSGGPLVDLNGSVVGINSSIAGTGSGGGGQSQAQSGNIGIGFAIPSDVATRVAAEIIATGEAPDTIMGVTVTGSDSTDPTAAGVPLQSVSQGSPAADAGLKAGDVVTKVNDFEVTTADGLIAATRYYAPGTEVTVTYTRSGDSHSTTVALGTA